MLEERRGEEEVSILYLVVDRNVGSMGPAFRPDSQAKLCIAAHPLVQYLNIVERPDILDHCSHYTQKVDCIWAIDIGGQASATP